MMRYTMVIDAGTGSVRALIFDEEAKEIAISQREWSHLSEDGVADSMSFDYRANWDLTLTCIKEVIAKSGIEASHIVAITASSMREGIICYDSQLQELFGVANVDARASKEVAYLNENFKGFERESYALSGQTFALGAIPRLLWLKNNRPALYDKVAYISMISDWVLCRLSGVLATEPSNAGTTGIFSLKERNWVGAMAKKVGLKDDIFPKVYESGEVIGEVKAEVADTLGLSRECKVVVGGGDVQLGSVGLGVVKRGDVAILGGTFWQQVVNIESDVIDKEMNLRINPHVIKGLSQAEGITFFSGMVMRWFRDTYCHEEVVQANKEGIDVYTLLESMAKEVPEGAYGVLPIFSDVMHYNHWMHAAPSFVNLSLDPKRSSKAVLFRALEENAAIVSKLNLDAIAKFSATSFESITFAGGASKGALWSQILADVTQKEIRVPQVKEATALGGAFVAGVGVGLYSSIEEAASSFVKFERSYEPRSEFKACYEDVAQRWQKAYSALLDLTKEGLLTPMWRAPGL